MVRENRITDSVKESLLLQATDEFTAAIDRGENPRIEDYAKRFPKIASSIRRLFPALSILERQPSRILQRIGDSHLPFDSLGGFQIVSEIGRGGMGIVYEAIEASLGRTVALKVLPFTTMLDQTQLIRFKNEAKAAATLNHRNIVSVYSVGEDRGVHFYAMQLIQGQSIGQAIYALQNAGGDTNAITEPNTPWRLTPDLDSHRDNSRSSVLGRLNHSANTPADSTRRIRRSNQTIANRSEDSNNRRTSRVFSESAAELPRNEYFNEVAKLGKQAASGLDHAHMHGILHRDIKPANMLIDANHQLWITDFGLAHIDTEAAITITGDLMGTVRYMSPEQASSRRTVDHRSDIYSLGVSLYELIALQPAFQSDERLELLKQIAEEDPPHLRKLSKGVPLDLATIIHKSIQKDPKDRYDSAAAMADDLQRFLDKKPIYAKPPSLSEIVSKWSVRHQSAVWSFFVSMMIVILLLTASIFFVTQAYQSTDDQRMRAETNLGLATKVIDDIYTKEIQRLQNAPGTTKEQREFFLKLVEFYENLPFEDRNNADLQHAAVKTQMRLASIYRALGEHEKSITILNKVIETTNSLCRRQPKSKEFQVSRIEAYDHLGQIQCDLQRLNDAIKTHETAGKFTNHLREQFPDEISVQRLVANQINLAAAYQETYTRESIFRETISQLKKLLLRYQSDPDVHDQPELPNDTVLEGSLAKARHALATILAATGRNVEAEQEFREAVRIQKRIVYVNPNAANSRFQLAQAESDLAIFLQDIGQIEEAKKINQAAIANLSQLTELYPDRTDYRSSLVKLHNEHGHLLFDDGLHHEASEKFQTAIGQLIILSDQSDDLPEYKASLMKNLSDLGVCHLRLNSPDNAKESFRKAIDLAQELCNRFPRNPDYQLKLAELRVNASRFDGFDNFVATTRKSIEKVKTLVERFPERIDFHEWLLNSHFNLGNLYYQQRKLTEAEQEYLTGMEITERFERTFPELDRSEKLAGQFTISGKVASGLGDFKPSSKFHRLAINNYRKLLEQNPNNEQFRANLSSNLKRLGHAQFRLSQFDEANRCYQESLQIAQDLATEYPTNPEYLGKQIRRTWLIAMLHLKQQELAVAEDVLRNQLQMQIEFDQRFPKGNSESISTVSLHVFLANLGLLRSPVRSEQAINELNLAINNLDKHDSLVPSTMLRLMLAQVYLWNGDTDNCQTIADQINNTRDALVSKLLSKSPPTLAVIETQLADLYASLQVTARAKELCDHVQTIPIESVDHQSLVGWHLARIESTGILDLSELQAKTALIAEQNPTNAQILDTQAMIDYRLESYEAAREKLSSARKVRKSPGLQNGFLMAMTLYRLGDVDQARNEYFEAFDNLPLIDPLMMIDVQRIQREAKTTLAEHRQDRL